MIKKKLTEAQNILSFIQQIQEYEQEKLSLQKQSIVTINDFLYEVSLLTDQDDNQNDSTDRVTLMTIHSAKGLEFPTIFITGLENGVFPSKHDLEDLRGLEEERRLFYVAITRAMERCYLCYAKRRFVNGDSRPQTRSMFLNDIDRQYIKSSYAYDTYNEVKPHWSFNYPSTAAFSQSQQIPSTPTIPVRPVTPVSGATSAIASSAWKAGDRVTHRVFGDGTVIRVYRDEVTENDKIEIHFDKQGTKTLLLTHAKLEKL